MEQKKEIREIIQEKFEIKLARYAQNIELIFIKSRSKLLTFQYKIGDIIWN